MRLIKRYSNRKLYDLVSKEYITLMGIAALIRDFQEISIIDNTTGEDLTAITLTQIILEYEKELGGVIPRTLLTDLVRSGGDRLASLALSKTHLLEGQSPLDEHVSRIFEMLNVPTREDIKQLEQQLDDLATSLDDLSIYPGAI